MILTPWTEPLQIEAMVHPNAGYLFYKRNFTDDPGVMDHTVNKRIEGIFEFLEKASYQVLYDRSVSISLTTTYPGLVTGSGYNHDAKDESEAYKIGFFFDHTTGMPVIPGHSVKGTLRGLFPNQFRWKDKEGQVREEWEAYAQLRLPLIRTLLASICSLDPESISDRVIYQLEEEIFTGLREGKAIPIYQRDVFNDAFPIEVERNNIGNKKRLFAKDNLTPHINRDNPELSPFSDPVPLKFLKVLPEVRYEFRFILQDSLVVPELKAPHKKKLFRALLLFNGIGAKTAVGYGQFTGKGEIQAEFVDSFTGNQGGMRGFTNTDPEKPKRTEPAVYKGKIKNQEGPLEAIIVNPDVKPPLVRIITENHGEFEVPVSGNCREAKGDLVMVVINQVDRKTKAIKEVGYRGPAKH